MECESLVFCDLSKEDTKNTKKFIYIKFHGLLGICIQRGLFSPERKALIFVDRITKSRYIKRHGTIKALSGIVIHELLHLCDWDASEHEVEFMELILLRESN